MLTFQQQLLEVLVPQNGTVADLRSGFQKKADLDEDSARNLRIYEAHSGKIYKELGDDFRITGLNEYVTLYAERIPEEEVNMQEGDRMINAFNFDREPSKPHGVPFKFVVKPVSPRAAVDCIRLHVAGRNLQGDEGTVIPADRDQGEAI